MFGWFKKRRPPPIPEEGGPRDWVLMGGEIGGKPAFVRIRVSLRDRADLAGYDHEVSATIAFHDLQPNGLPGSGEEMTAVDRIEDQIQDALRSGSKTLLGLVITSDGVRVCYFYTAEPAAVGRIWERELQPEIESHAVELRIRPDKDWQVYRRFLDQSAEGPPRG